jgi:hypothetical protein
MDKFYVYMKHLISAIDIAQNVGHGDEDTREVMYNTKVQLEKGQAHQCQPLSKTTPKNRNKPKGKHDNVQCTGLVDKPPVKGRRPNTSIPTPKKIYWGQILVF